MNPNKCPNHKGSTSVKTVRVALGIPFLLLGVVVSVLGAGLIALGLRIQGERLLKTGE